MPRFTISAHYLIHRTVYFVRDDMPMDESYRWLWFILRRDTPANVLSTNDPTLLLLWSERCGHQPTKLDCHQEAVKWLSTFDLTPI